MSSLAGGDISVWDGSIGRTLGGLHAVLFLSLVSLVTVVFLLAMPFSEAMDKEVTASLGCGDITLKSGEYLRLCVCISIIYLGTYLL